MDINTFVSTAIKGYRIGGGTINPKTITDDIFCHIENNTALYNDYRTLLPEHRSQQQLNRKIACLIKDNFGFISLKTRNTHPRSKLIQGYTEFRIP